MHLSSIGGLLTLRNIQRPLAISPKKTDAVNKMKPNILTLIVMLISINLCGQTSFDFIDKIQDYQQNVKFDDSSDYTIIDSKTFDIDEYLAMFDKLTIESSLRPQVFYVANMFGGCPYLVAIQDTFDVSKYVESELKKVKKDKYYDPDDARGKIMSDLMSETSKLRDFIVPTHSEEGIIQYLFYNEMAESFALFWHFNYKEKRIVSSTEKFKDRIKPFRKGSLYSIDKKKYASLKKQEMSPKVSLKDDKYIVEWYEIETHNGVYKRKYEIENFAPYNIKKIDDEIVLPIQANFLY